ncbi:toll/interleukin-1 receptor domain-containing protein [Hymenobacter sp.]|jgi:hypothetical protein|uniref:toll/interleukin-1 receptor domain-containing protein n=1 Tax=Hymenobacter sp. TaxID=1898978 RepID=UPI002ED8EF0F
MQTVPYQIVLLGENETGLKQLVHQDLLLKIQELGLNTDEHVTVLEATEVASFSRKAPIVGIFFGGATISAADIAAVNQLVSEDVVVIPVVEDLGQYQQLVPSCLYDINGLEVQAAIGGIDNITNTALEVLSLLRKTRKLFISYRRQESRAIAIQLYEHLDGCGFDVFIDTISIRPAETFQETLWHRLSDTDVVVLLDTPGFLASRWTSEELARASAMSIGIIQVIWPEHNPEPASGLCERYYLSDADFKLDGQDPIHRLLRDGAVSEITRNVESLRARALSARYSNIVGELGSVVQELSMDLAIQPYRYAIVDTGTVRIAVIPTVGLPEAVRYQEIAELLETIKELAVTSAVLLYDNRNMRKRWQAHLSWLNEHLPIKSVRVIDSKRWLTDISQ